MNTRAKQSAILLGIFLGAMLLVEAVLHIGLWLAPVFGAIFFFVSIAYVARK